MESEIHNPISLLGGKATVKILQGTRAPRQQLCNSCSSQLDPQMDLCNPIKTLMGVDVADCCSIK